MLPSQAIRELENDTNGLVMQIIRLRAFAGAKSQFDNTKRAIDLPHSRMMDIYKDTMFDVQEEDKAERRAAKERQEQQPPERKPEDRKPEDDA